MKVNETITLDVTDLSFDAMGIGEDQGKRVFMNNALPGEKVQAKVVQISGNHAIARVTKILKKSPARNNGENDQWAKDGFANLANMKYANQLQFKKKLIERALKSEGLTQIEVADVIPSPKQEGYRNQRLVYVRNYHGKLEFGFLRPFTHEFAPISNFLTTNKDVVKALKAIKEVLRKLKIPAYDPVTNSGFVRNVDVRRSNDTGKIMVVLVVNQKDRPDMMDLVGQTYAKLPNLYSFAMNYNPHRTKEVWGKMDIPLFGENCLTDKIGDLTFRISPQSYFQFNSLLAPKVREIAIQEAQLNKDSLVVDAYSGVGTIGLLAAKQAKEVRGIEKVKASVLDARASAKLNKIDNAKFYQGDADTLLARWQKEGYQPDVVFVDPPHKGVSKGFLETVAKMGVKRLVYVSSNPSTLARDIKRMQAEHYECKKITPLDLSPQKSRIKCVTTLELNK